MKFEIDLNTGPNHQYSDLEAEQLVYKLLTLVLDHRISFKKKGCGGRGGRMVFFGDFS